MQKYEEKIPVLRKRYTVHANQSLISKQVLSLVKKTKEVTFLLRLPPMNI